jgi:hypothetical protein
MRFGYRTSGEGFLQAVDAAAEEVEGQAAALPLRKHEPRPPFAFSPSLFAFLRRYL